MNSLKAAATYRLYNFGYEFFFSQKILGCELIRLVKVLDPTFHNFLASKFVDRHF